MDKAETWHRAQCYRRSILRHLANPEEKYRRPPSTLRRIEAVILRRAQTGQLLSPARLHLINPRSYVTPQCPLCPARGTTEHILWHCPAFTAVRETALQSLGVRRPGTLKEWIDPPSHVGPSDALRLWRAFLQYFKDERGPGRFFAEPTSGPPHLEDVDSGPPPPPP